MNFKKKLKMRLYSAIALIVAGIAMIVSSFIVKNQNDFMSSYGFALFLCGLVFIRNYFIITKNEESIKRREIAETDERNIMLSQKAKSLAFSIYCIVSGIAIIVMHFLNEIKLSTSLAYSVCILMLLYWISYFIIRKRT